MGDEFEFPDLTYPIASILQIIKRNKGLPRVVLPDGKPRTTEQLYESVCTLYAKSPFSSEQAQEDFISKIALNSLRDTEDLSDDLILAIREFHRALLSSAGLLNADFSIPEDPHLKSKHRTRLLRLDALLNRFERANIFIRYTGYLISSDLVERLPPPEPEATQSFYVPLIEMIDEPHEYIRSLYTSFFGDLSQDEDSLLHSIHETIRHNLLNNILSVSRITEEEASAYPKRLVFPDEKSTADELLRYLVGTPFYALLREQLPYSIPDETRFEHTHLVGGTGHGKTQTLGAFLLRA